jgi:hypothetical protein
MRRLPTTCIYGMPPTKVNEEERWQIYMMIGIERKSVRKVRRDVEGNAGHDVARSRDRIRNAGQVTRTSEGP